MCVDIFAEQLVLCYLFLPTPPMENVLILKEMVHSAGLKSACIKKNLLRVAYMCILFDPVHVCVCVYYRYDKVLFAALNNLKSIPSIVHAHYQVSVRDLCGQLYYMAACYLFLAGNSTSNVSSVNTPYVSVHSQCMNTDALLRDIFLHVVPTW